MQTVYFTRDNYYEKDLRKDDSGMTHLAMYRADVVSPGEWNNIVEMPFNDKDFSVGHPTLSSDNKTLFFVSDVPGTYGKTDIFKVTVYEDGTYSEPKNLGKKINTEGREMFPFMADDGFLYFSSDRAGGSGNLDVYAVHLESDSEVINLGSPINSFKDDFAFLKKSGQDYGYFSSNRSGGHGDDDIYYFKELEPLKAPCNQVVTGVVTDELSGAKIPGALVVLYDANGNQIDNQIVKSDAIFSFELDCEANYKVIGSKELYSEDTESFIANPNLELGLTLRKDPVRDVQPMPVVTQSEFDRCQGALDLINNIYFDLDKDFIRPDAASELDKVIRIMKRCPNINVDASSHTDSRASFSYNEDLSQRRAQSTVNYLVSVGGIDQYRLKAVGYGETRLRNHCSDGVNCSETEHQMNRRTQFEVSNY
jgi:outer membrane protein OmpA-like peptidoglycan-associated protein